MALNSMTGFGRASGETQSWRWAWEVRSVNGRGLDVRIRLPSTFDNLDPLVRKSVQSRLKRGSVTVSLAATRTAGAMQVQINQDVLNDVLKAANAVQQVTNVSPASVDGLLAIKGVLDVVEPDEDQSVRKDVESALLSGLETALEALRDARQSEGERLRETLSDKVSEIAILTEKIESSPSRAPECVQARLKEQVAKLIESSDKLDDARLYQEAVLIATRADVEEEVKRLSTHIAAAQSLLQRDEPVGRQLDFLAQEFNREANTICSKAGADDISQAGLALKTAIDQLREQVQNIE